MFEKKDEQDFEEKILPVILSFMPAYRMHGESKMQSVSSRWRYYLSDQKLQSKKSAFEFEKSIEACSTPEEALLILTDFGLYSHCRLWQLIHLASLHPRIAKEAIDTPLIRTKYPFFLPDLASRHVELAHYVVTLAETTPISLQDLVRLGKKHFDVGWRLLNSPQWRSQLQGKDLAELGEAHLRLANYILNCEELANKLAGMQLSKLMEPHTASLCSLLENPNFNQYLLSTALHNLNKIDFLFAHAILNKPDLAQRLSALHLLSLAKAGPTVANRILRNPNLLAKIQRHSREFAKFGSLYAVVAFKIIDTPALFESIADSDLAILGRNHFSVAERLLNTPALRERILNAHPFWDLEGFSINGFPLARKLKNDGKGYGLTIMGEHNAQTAHQILTRPELYEQGKLTGNDLAKLGSSDVRNGWLVLSTPFFSLKLNGDDIETLGVSHPRLAYAILNNPSLCSRLSGKNLAALGESDAHVALHILKTESMFLKLNGDELLKLTGYFKCRTKAYESYHIGIIEIILRYNLDNNLIQEGGNCGLPSSSNEKIVEDLQNSLRLSEVLYRIANEVKAEQSPKQSLPRPTRP